MRLIDADGFKKNILYSCDLGGWLEPVLTAIKDYICKQVDCQITIDAVEVVRCKDCKWYDTRFFVCHNPRFGDGWANYQPPKVREDFFCTDGERKDDV